MSFTFIDTAFDNDKPFFSGGQHQQAGPPPMNHPQSNQQRPAMTENRGIPVTENRGPDMSHQYPSNHSNTSYGAPRNPGAGGPPGQGYHQPRQVPVSSGAPMEYQEPVVQQKQQQEENERRQYEQLYAMGKLMTKQQEDNALVVQSMKQYCSSLEVLLFIIIAFCVVMVIVQIVVCRKVMTLTKLNSQQI